MSPNRVPSNIDVIMFPKIASVPESKTNTSMRSDNADHIFYDKAVFLQDRPKNLAQLVDQHYRCNTENKTYLAYLLSPEYHGIFPMLILFYCFSCIYFRYPLSTIYLVSFLCPKQFRCWVSFQSFSFSRPISPNSWKRL